MRTFGLAGKVVILDEVHSYDSYTGTILNELVGALRELHCTVIILSATLTDKQRHSILGLGVLPNDLEQKETLSPYPLISAYPIENELREIETEKLEDFKVAVCISSSEEDAVAEVLRRAERGNRFFGLKILLLKLNSDIVFWPPRPVR